jgi:hypothetical protein
MKVPVFESAGLTVTDVPWALIRNTPVEDALQTTTDEKGSFRFPSVPARSALNLLITSKGMTTHRTSDWTKRGTLGMRPSGFVDGFLHGTPDSPAKIYPTPETDRTGQNRDANTSENE